MLYIGVKPSIVKKIFLFIITFFYLYTCFAQDTIEVKDKLSDSVIERFFVLKSDKKTRVGPYKAFFRRRTVVASGNYNNNKKTGVWNFYNQAGQLVQTYNYDTNTITFEAPQRFSNDLVYAIDDTLKKNDKGVRPLKIGGVYYGYIPYLTIFQLPFDAFGINTDSFEGTVELLISPLGRLASYKVHLISDLYQYDHTFTLDVRLFNEEDRQFVPASINNEHILSRVIIKCGVTPGGGIEFW